MFHIAGDEEHLLVLLLSCLSVIFLKVLLHSHFSQINNGRIRTREGKFREAENIRDVRNDLNKVT